MPFIDVAAVLNDCMEANDFTEFEKLLKRRRWDLDTPNAHDFTLLVSAVIKNSVAGVKFLLKEGAGVNTLSRGGTVTPLHQAASDGRVEIMQVLLDAGANISGLNRQGLTPMATAAGLGQVEAVKFLLKAGVSVKDVNDQTSPLHAAATNGYPAVIDVLVEAGADPNYTSTGVATPINSAAQAGCLEAVKTLLRHGASPDGTPSAPALPLRMAIRFGHVEVVRTLLEAGADFSSPEVIEIWHLGQACRHPNMWSTMTEFLISTGMKDTVMERAREHAAQAGEKKRAAASAQQPAASVPRRAATSGVDDPQAQPTTTAPGCAVCHAPAPNRCSRCKLVFYCSAECQRKHWKEGGHKKECKAEAV